MHSKHALQHQALLDALQEMVGNFKKTRNFQNLKICELLFYSRPPLKIPLRWALSPCGFLKSLFSNRKILFLEVASNITNRHVAKILALDEGLIAVVKHRALKQLRKMVAKHYQLPDDKSSISDAILSEIWESQRLSCPKRSTLGAFLLKSIEPDWFDYVDFHLTTLGCHFCRASFKDLQYQQTREKQTAFKNRIMASTIGFFSKPA